MAQLTNQVSQQAPACHVGPKFVMKIGQASIYAGSYRELVGDYDWGLMIRLFDNDVNLRAYNTVVMNSAAEKILPKALVDMNEMPPIVDLEWPDFGVPDYSKEWWKLLYTTIKDLGEVDVVIFCMGGHGRTGTALSILAGLNSKAKDPVAWVRKHYCEKAVETQSQITYVQFITGRSIASKPSSFWGRPSGYTYVPADSSQYTGITTAKPTISYAHTEDYDPFAATYREEADGSWVIVPPEKQDEPEDDDGSFSGVSHHREPVR